MLALFASIINYFCLGSIWGKLPAKKLDIATLVGNGHRCPAVTTFADDTAAVADKILIRASTGAE